MPTARILPLLVLGSALVVPPCAAAPPTLTYLFPAGAQRGKTVEVAAAGTFERWPVRVWVDGKGVDVKAGTDRGKLTVTVAEDAPPGTCWIRLYDEQGASALRPFIVGTLPEVLEQEPNDDFKKAQVISGNAVTINGKLEKAGDVDCFALKLTKGQTLVASIEAHRTLGSPMDGVLQVLSQDGFLLEENNDYHGLDPQVIFTVPKDGTYIVRLFAFPAMPDASVRLAGGEQYVYRLTLTTEGFVDHAFPLAAARAEPGSVELVGWNLSDAAKKHTLARGLADERVSFFHPQVAGAAQVRLEPHPTIIWLADPQKQPQAISLPLTISGRLERKGEVHAFAFEAKKGQKLSFLAEARGLGFPIEPVLRVTDASGKTLAQAEGPMLGRDPELAFTVPQDGKYQIEVRDLHASGSPRHLYRLRAVPAEPDFALTLAADRFTLVPGKPLDIPLTIERRHGFNLEIELSVEGLPKGVSAITVQTGPPANAKTVTLRLTAEAMPAGGTVRIIGKAKGQPEAERTARATLEGLSASTPHVWLTVPAQGK
ncbi:MAG: pre-peptidase C-terminal domain-containing protein [Gemmataceae bacterium]|nr:pre-peptidase C-terminal domain-containing protein [Gemmataceae bacterium]